MTSVEIESDREIALKMLDDADRLRAAASAAPSRADGARLRADADQLLRTARRLLRRAPTMP